MPMVSRVLIFPDVGRKTAVTITVGAMLDSNLGEIVTIVLTAPTVLIALIYQTQIRLKA